VLPVQHPHRATAAAAGCGQRRHFSRYNAPDDSQQLRRHPDVTTLLASQRDTTLPQQASTPVSPQSADGPAAHRTGQRGLDSYNQRVHIR